MMKILVLSNMSPKKSAPLQGLFVDNQVQRLQAVNKNIDYYKMRWNSDSLLGRVFKYPVFLLQFFFDIVFKRQKYALIHVHFFFPTIILAACYKLLINRHVKIVVTCHGSDVYSYVPPNYLYKKLSYFVDKWIFTSKELQHRFFRCVESAIVLCAGYDDNLFFPSDIITDKTYDYIQIGSLDYNKGIERFLYLVENFPKQQFALVGEGPLKDLVIDATNRFSNLHYLGKQSPKDLVYHIRRSKFLLSLSKHESFGLTITEGHACGVPCIATLTDGSTAQIQDKVRLIPQLLNNEELVLKKLKDTLTYFNSLDKTDYANLSCDVSSHTKEFSLSYITEELLAIYSQCLKGHSNEC